MNVGTQTKESPWSAILAPATTAWSLIQMFSGVRLSPCRTKVKLVVQIIPNAGAQFELAIAISDGISSPGLVDQNLSGAGGVPLTYEIRWGDHESGLLIPSGSGAQAAQPGLYRGANNQTLQLGMQADMSVGGHPDSSGTLSANLAIIAATGSPTFTCSANMITWGD
jgi:hypothetical protein